MMTHARPRTPPARPRATSPRAASPRESDASTPQKERSTPRVQIPAREKTPAREKAIAREETPAHEKTPAPRFAIDRPSPDLATGARYDPRDLAAVAELARHYLFHGNLEVARILLEGLTAIAPADARFALALAVTYDRLNLKPEADAEYRLTAHLDPTDARPDIHRAELLLERSEGRDRPEARRLLTRGAQKAQQKNDHLLERKARALLARLDRKEER